MAFYWPIMGLPFIYQYMSSFHFIFDLCVLCVFVVSCALSPSSFSFAPHQPDFPTTPVLHRSK